MTIAPAQDTACRRYPLRIFKLVVVLAALTAIFSQLDPQVVAHVLNANILTAIAAEQVLLLAGTVAGAWRYSLLVRTPPAPCIACFNAMIITHGLNLIIPGRIAEIVKATYLRQHVQIPISSSITAMLIERLFDICIVALIGFIGAVGLYVEGYGLLWAGLAAGIGGLAMLRPISRFVLRWSGKRHGRLWDFLTASQTAVVLAAIMFAGAVPALPGGIGLVQAAVTLALVHIGFPPQEAFVLSIALHASEFILSACIAPILLVFQPIGLADVMRRAELSPQKVLP